MTTYTILLPIASVQPDGPVVITPFREPRALASHDLRGKLLQLRSRLLVVHSSARIPIGPIVNLGVKHEYSP